MLDSVLSEVVLKNYIHRIQRWAISVFGRPFSINTGASAFLQVCFTCQFTSTYNVSYEFDESFMGKKR